MPSLEDVSQIPILEPTYRLELEKEDEEELRGLVILAEIKNVLHFRIYSKDHRILVDTDENRLKGTSKGVGDLKKTIGELKKDIGALAGIIEALEKARDSEKASKKAVVAEDRPQEDDDHRGLSQEGTGRQRKIPQDGGVDRGLQEASQGLWPPPMPTEDEKQRVFGMVMSIVGPIQLHGEAIIADLRERFARRSPRRSSRSSAPRRSGASAGPAVSS